uniref:Uncharacterized protein n=1 Tax=Arundo donax TaxID=35708 RepID=A0A0A9B8R9_ARUDO
MLHIQAKQARNAIIFTLINLIHQGQCGGCSLRHAGSMLSR